MAQSIARLVFWNDQPAETGLGTRISVSSSPVSSAVSNSPRKNSSARIWRSPSDLRVTRAAFSARTTAGRSEAGFAVRQGAANGAAVTDLRIADPAGGESKQRQFAAEQAGVLKVMVAGERPDGDVIIFVADIAQIGQPTMARLALSGSVPLSPSGVQSPVPDPGNSALGEQLADQ